MPAYSYNVPAIDDKNPFYCPSVSANTYLNSLRHRVRIHKPTSTTRRRGQELFISFARTLDQSTSESDADDDVDWIVGSYVSHARAIDPGVLKPLSPPPYSAFVNDLERKSTRKHDGHGSIETTVLKRRRLSSFSDLHGPPKYSRSAESWSTCNASTKFDITHNREPLKYLVASSPAIKPEPECHPKPLTQPDLDKLIKDLDAVIPGIRLSERLKNIKDASPQAITDFLSEHGHINGRILDILRTTDVERISLVNSLFDENGLNLCGKDLFPAFNTPNTFLSLTELSFSGTRVHDFDLIHIHHLPKLSILFLNNTGIGNEAVYLLIPLKRTLTQLTLATNPDIDSTSVPAILLLSKLCYLSIADTSIDMNGLRTLAKRVDEEGWVVDIEVPWGCEDYIDNIPNAYLLHPSSPLITDPEACSALSCAALRRNLSAHAESNSAIVVGGTKDEMVLRLEGLLRTRKLDLLVRRMIGIED